MQAEIVDVLAGQVQGLIHGGVTVPSAVVKHPIEGAAWAGPEGLSGDVQADRKNHGGPRKALLVYPREHYSDPASPAGGLAPASLGENLSTLGLLETDVHMGDVFAIGRAVVQVSQPRRPCFKLGARHGVRDLALQLQTVGQTGYYLAVLEPGDLCAGQQLTLYSRQVHGVSVAEVNRVLNVDKDDLDAARHLLEVCDDLPERWRQTLTERLTHPGTGSEDAARLTGV